MKTGMAWVLWFVMLASQSTAQLVVPPPLSEMEQYLYTQLEDALVNDGGTLERLRKVFFQTPRPHEVQFLIHITVDSIAADNCSRCEPDCYWVEPCEPAFCPPGAPPAYCPSMITSEWELRSDLSVTWATDVDAVELIQVLANTVLPWCTHGLSFVVLLYSWYNTDDGIPSDAAFACEVGGPIRLYLWVKELGCKPFTYQITNAVGELITWVSEHQLARVHQFYQPYIIIISMLLFTCHSPNLSSAYMCKLY